MSDQLTPKQQRFLDEYFVDFNATRAYKAAGYTVKNDNVAAVSAKNLLRNSKIDAAFKKEMEERNKQVAVDKLFVLEYLKGAVELDLEHYAKVGKKGVTIQEFQKINQKIKRYVTEVSQSETKTGKVVVNFKVFSKEKAMDMLAKHTGASIQRVELSGELTVNSISDLVNSNT